MKRIDRIARHLATRATRRDVLNASAVGAVSVSLLGRTTGVLAQEATPELSGEDVMFLFVQTGASGTFEPNPGAGTPIADGTPVAGGGAEYLLTLEGHDGHTIYFSDRPERIAGAAPTDSFLNGLGFLQSNPPNAALVTAAEDGEQLVVVLELFTPVYDDEADTITYGATILAEYEGEGLSHVADQGVASELPESFGNASLFIDDCPDITECVTMAMRNIILPVGPIPGGPYGMCWHWSSFSCHPCDTSLSGDDLNAMCNQAYEPDCGNNQCYAM